MIAETGLAACLILAAIAAIWDVRLRKIPNLLCVAMGVCALGYLFLSEGQTAAGGAAVHSLIALVVGMVLFRFGVIGGGDAKFYAAAALGIPLGNALFMLGATSVSGLVLILAMVAFRLVGLPIGPRDAKGRALVPYGVAIASGFALTTLNASPASF